MIPPSPLSPWAARGAVAVACLAAFALHLPSLLFPQLLHDDFEIFLASWTPSDTRTNLWVPMNEHSWPLTRLLTSAVIETSGHRQSWLPLLSAIPPRIALLLALLLTFRFVTKHTGSSFAGLAAVIVFGVTAAYQEALYWYAAHPPLWCVCHALLALRAADRWEGAGRWWWLAAVFAWSFFAPGWFAGGVIVGPLVGLYLVLGKRGGWRKWAAGAVAFGAAVLFLAVSWHHAGDQINRPQHFQGKSMLGSLDPLTGAGMTARAVVDQIAVAAAGVFGFAMPVAVVAVAFPLLLWAGVWWWRGAADRRLVLLGAGFIFGSDVLIYSARGGWSYADQLQGWSRYNVYPWFGFMLMIVGGPKWSPGSLTRRQAKIGLIATTMLFAVQLPRSLMGTAGIDPEQPAVMRKLEEIDRKCVEHRVSAKAAQDGLPQVLTDYWEERDAFHNCMELLWGSPDPLPRTQSEVRRLVGE